MSHCKEFSVEPEEFVVFLFLKGWKFVFLVFCSMLAVDTMTYMVAQQTDLLVRDTENVFKLTMNP